MSETDHMKKYTFEDVQPKEGGPLSLYCHNCGEWVTNTANYEMRKEGFYAHSHMCIKWPDGRIEVL